MRKLLLILGLLAVLAATSHADRIVLVPADVLLKEPGQKALVAFNGQEELLILATDLAASKATRALQILPLPGKPVVQLGDPKLLDNLGELMRARSMNVLQRSQPGTTVKLVSHQKLGPHDLIVLELSGTDQLDAIVRKHLGQGLSPDAIALVRDYLRAGCRYLAIDLVEVGTEPGSVPPVAYRFETDELFYPLRTSNLVGGEGSVDLFLILPYKVHTLFPQLPFPTPAVEEEDFYLSPVLSLPETPPTPSLLPPGSRYLLAGPCLVRRPDVEALDPVLKGFMPRQNWFLLHHYEGPLQFSHDLRLSAQSLGLTSR